MKNRLLALAVGLLGLCAILSCVPIATFASTTTSLLPTEGFSSTTFPPANWSMSNSPTCTSCAPGGWTHASGGDGGSNGSAICNVRYIYTFYSTQTRTVTLNAPIVDASSFSTNGDSTFVDFDLWMPHSYYDQYYYGNPKLDILANGTSILTLDPSKTSDRTITLNGYYVIYDPNSGYTSSSYWRHYHVPIAATYRTAGMQISFQVSVTPQYSYYYYAYSDNIAIDNVSIYNTRYTSLKANPAALSFGSLGVGNTSSTQYVKLTNPNSTQVTISNIGFAGSSPADYTLTRTITTIDPGMTDSIGVAFAPTAKGIRQANLVYNANVDIGGSGVVALNGTGLVPIISIPAGLQPFRGTRTRFRVTQTFSFPVTNIGTPPLIVSSATNVSGPFPNEYAITRLPAGPIPAGQTDTITITYSPTFEGSAPGYLNVVSNADNGTQTLRLYGIGVLPRLSVFPSPLNFDSVKIGTTQCAEIVLHNPGTDTIFLKQNYFSSADADFAITTLSGADTIIPPDGTKRVNVCFTPIRNGLRQARFRATTNIPTTFEAPSRDTSSFQINILGEGVPYGSLAVSGTAIVDSEIVGQQLCTTDTFSNNGTAPITLTGASITGPNASEFTFSGVTFPVVVQPGGSQTFSLCGTPASRGDRNASLVVTGMNNGSALTASLPIDIYGQLVCATATPGTAFTANTCAGMTDTAVISVSNCGDVSAPYSAALSSGATQYHIVGATTSAITGPGASAQFTVVFTPNARGAQNATLNITGPNGINQSVNLTGTGQAATIAGSGVADSTHVNQTSKPFDVTIKNTGECDWTPGTPTVSDPQFIYVSGGNTPIAAGATGTLSFTFAPTKQGMQNANVTFASANGVSIPAPAVTVQGFGQPVAGVARTAEANGYSLMQNYPNPFNPTTEIRFVLPKDGMVKLEIIDVTGKVVRTVIDQRMTAGEHATVVNASDLASGAYYYQLTAGSIVLTRQMVLSK